MFFPKDKVLSSNPNTPGFANHEASSTNAWRFYDDANLNSFPAVPMLASSCRCWRPRAGVGVLANMIEAEQNPSVIHPENDAQS